MNESRALLLTDVVDSTKLSEELGDEAMADVWAAHDRVARDLLIPHKGREIDKTDGMLLLFDGASQAVNYALAYHLALAAMHVPLKARAGLHVGPVILRENSADDVARGAKPLEVDGLAKPTAARVMSLAVGGQTLLTPEAREDLGKTELKLQSHGHWVIKGVSEPIELFEVGEPERRMLPPADSEKVHRVIKVNDIWMPVKEIPHNLPSQGTSFVGREKELDDIKGLLGSARLVTLLGMGGLGKTRLSLQAAAELLHQFPDGVWFLDLSPITDPALAFSEAAQVLGVREEPDRPLLQTLCNHLKNKRLLMVFDNCEHLIKASADLAHAVVKAAPHVRLAASSREALRIPGERAYPIMPLPVPKVGDSVAVLLQSTAVRLFVARAQAHKPSFELDDSNAAAVAELVSRLEGIPLALELAAARVRALSIADINKRLNDRYKLLTGGARVHQERQQTLRALVDWSYDMLPDSEKTLLNRLSVFKGGWDMEAAEAVCGTDPLDPMDVLDLLTNLVEKSLVIMEEGEETSRYKMLETIRDYAREKLEESGELGAVAATHCQYYFAMAKEANRGQSGSKQGAWLDRLEAEIDNLRAAIALANSGGVENVIAVKLAVALQGFWILRGYATEGRAVVRSVLQNSSVASSEMAKAHSLYVGAALSQSQADLVEAKTMLEECLVLRRRLGVAAEIAMTISTLALVTWLSGDSRMALEQEQEALLLFQTCGHKVGEGVVLLQIGEIYAHMADDGQSEEYILRALSIAKEVKHFETEAHCNLILGQLAFGQGNFSKAQTCIDTSLKIGLASENRRAVASASWWKGKIELNLQRLESAQGYLKDALGAFNAFEMKAELAGCLEDYSSLAASFERPEQAISFAAGATSIRESYALKRSVASERRWQQHLDQLRTLESNVRLEDNWPVLSAIDLAKIIRDALVLNQ